MGRSSLHRLRALRYHTHMARSCMLQGVPTTLPHSLLLHWSIANSTVTLPNGLLAKVARSWATIRDGCHIRCVISFARFIKQCEYLVEGFSSWMFKGLTFLLPFLLLGYVSVSFDLLHDSDIYLAGLTRLLLLLSCAHVLRERLLRRLASTGAEHTFWHHELRQSTHFAFCLLEEAIANQKRRYSQTYI